MDQTFRSLLLRYQNYLLEFFQLIEDKNLIVDDLIPKSNHIRNFLENLPEPSGEFEISMSVSKHSGEYVATWSIDITEDGFSFRSFSVEDEVELDEWHLHYYNSTQEYEGNLFNDGDWDLYLEEIADLDEYDGSKLSCLLNYEMR